MRKILFVAAAAGLMFTACNKKDDKKGGSSSDTFKINGKTYSAAYVTTVAGAMMASSTSSADLTGGSVQVGFGGMTTLPTKSGTYKITSDAVAEDEISVTFSETNSGNVTAYSAMNGSGKTATVNINGGKVQVIIPEIWVYEEFTGKDSVLASASFQQK